ncbi:hypothetical protein F2P56_036305 [Juglans regia]|uniref:D-isomer specific 2-hydroxyacid dehydrogenase catalytic domain-containing protein n=1 Tax=Juglans regia TaxID=51240 RepID=A0A833WUQ8_JUGRE|nr:hypothetical protein F2P56_036305 [Juglans regia]
MENTELLSQSPCPELAGSISYEQDCRVEICTKKKTILSVEGIVALIGDKCDGVIGQLTENWGEALFSTLRRSAGGTAFSNMAVAYNNVDVNAANKYGVAVGNTPVLVLTETTTELAGSLFLAAARRIVEADEFVRAGLYDGCLPNLFACLKAVSMDADPIRVFWCKLSNS